MNIVEFLEARIREDEQQAERHYANATAHGLGSYPIRILDECAAKRAMLANVPTASSTFDPLGGTSAYVLMCLASIYKYHPDYQQEWMQQVFQVEQSVANQNDAE